MNNKYVIIYFLDVKMPNNNNCDSLWEMVQLN